MSEDASNRGGDDSSSSLARGKESRSSTPLADEEQLVPGEEAAAEPSEQRSSQCLDDLREEQVAPSSSVAQAAAYLRVELREFRNLTNEPIIERDVQNISGSVKAFCEAGNGSFHVTPDYRSRRERINSFTKASGDDLELLKAMRYNNKALECTGGCGMSIELHHRNCDEEKIYLDDDVHDDDGKVFCGPNSAEYVNEPGAGQNQYEEGDALPQDEVQNNATGNQGQRPAVQSMPRTVHLIARDGCFYTENGYTKCHWCLKAAALKLENCKCPRNGMATPDVGDHGCDNPATNG